MRENRPGNRDLRVFVVHIAASGCGSALRAVHATHIASSRCAFRMNGVAQSCKLPDSIVSFVAGGCRLVDRARSFPKLEPSVCRRYGGYGGHVLEGGNSVGRAAAGEPALPSLAKRIGGDSRTALAQEDQGQEAGREAEDLTARVERRGRSENADRRTNLRRIKTKRTVS